MRQALDRRNPGDKALFHLPRIQRRKDAIKRIVRWNTRWKRQNVFNHSKLSSPYSAMFPVPLHARIAHLCKIPQGIFHIPLSPIYIPVAYSNLYASALGLQVFFGRGEPDEISARDSDRRSRYCQLRGSRSAGSSVYPDNA